MVAVRKDASSWVKHALYLLRDGEWHGYVEIVDVLARMVPPGLAYRRGQKGYKDRERSKPIDKELVILYGSRQEVRTSLRGMRESGRIETKLDRRGRPTHVRLSQKEKETNPWTVERGRNESK